MRKGSKQHVSQRFENKQEKQSSTILEHSVGHARNSLQRDVDGRVGDVELEIAMLEVMML